MAGRPRVALYAEVDTNLIDGSSVWLQSVALMLAERADVTVLLRTAERRDVITAPLHGHPHVKLVDAGISSRAVRVLPPGAAVERLGWLDVEERFDVFLWRGAAVAELALLDRRLADRSWLYYVPPAGEAVRDDQERVQRWLAGAQRVLVQTDEMAEEARRIAPSFVDRVTVLPPVVPAMFAAGRADQGEASRRIAYVGKMTPEYGFDAMLELLARLRERDPDVELHVAGDKIHAPAQDPGFRDRAAAALAATPGLVYHDALPRDEIATLLHTCDAGFALREGDASESRELSTKLLEYSVAGCPPLVKRGAVAAALLGDDYPLFCDTAEQAADALAAAWADPAALAAARERARAAAEPFLAPAVAGRLVALLAPRPPQRAPRRGRRVLLAGHQLHFAADLAAHLEAAGAEVRRDTWLRHGVHVPEQSRTAAAWADIVVCEWCLGNAAWYARSESERRRLVVRFHRMELETAYPVELDLERVDAMVFVAEHVRRSACARFLWEPDDERFRVIPNTVDAAALALPKRPGFEFTVALLGWIPSLKRVDRALDVIERLRAADDRFRLVCKGRAPWEMAGLLSKPAEEEFFERVFDRVHHAPGLKGAVHFEPGGDDVAQFLSGAGWVLSTSDIEGHAVALAEGMAAGCVPVILDRQGAADQYDARWLHEDPAHAAAAMLAVHRQGARAAEAERARDYAARWTWPAVEAQWREVLGLSEQPRQAPPAARRA